MNTSDGITFQVCLALGIVVFILLRLYYSIRSRITHDLLPIPPEKRWIKIPSIIIIAAWGSAVILWLIKPDWLGWSLLALPEWLGWMGVGLMTIGLGLMAWAHETLGGSFSATLEIRAPRQLITAGPYKFLRHPMYAAILISSLAVCLITGSWFIFLLSIPLQILSWMLRVPSEEALMVEEFGASYVEYRSRTGGFFPRF